MDGISRRGFIVSGVSLASAAKIVLAQDPPVLKRPQQEQEPAPSFSSEVKVVNVLATVRDKKGNLVDNLTKDDFVLTEDDHPEVIKYFARQTDLPLVLGLLIDTSGSMRREFEKERSASYKFFDKLLREDKDKAFVLHFDREVELLQDMTSSKKSLDRSLDNLDTSSSSGGGGGGGGYGGRRGGGGGGGGRSGGGTCLYDAVYLASNDLMKKETGRKAVILLTDGVDNGSKETLTSAIESAQRADLLVYSMHYSGEEYGGMRPGMGGMGGGRRGGGMGGGGSRYPQQQHADGKKVLERLSRETGGAYFDVSGHQSLDKLYEKLDEELRNQYSLGYTSDQKGTDYRKISVTISQKNLVVQARDGYYPR